MKIFLLQKTKNLELQFKDQLRLTNVRYFEWGSPCSFDYITNNQNLFELALYIKSCFWFVAVFEKEWTTNDEKLNNLLISGFLKILLIFCNRIFWIKNKKYLIVDFRIVNLIK